MLRIISLFVSAALLPAQTSTPPVPPAADANPRVAPGLVRWYADLAQAKEAARRQRRPVLLLQLLGDLDREFC